RLLRQAGLNAPEVIAADETNGFLLLTDLGRATYLDVLNDDNATGLFEEAIDALVLWQLATRPGGGPRLHHRVARGAGRAAAVPAHALPPHRGAKSRPTCRLRAPRLHASQPDGGPAGSGSPRFPGRC